MSEEISEVEVVEKEKSSRGGNHSRSPEERIRISNKVKLNNEDPEYKEAVRKALIEALPEWTDERKAKSSNSIRASWTGPGLRKRIASLLRRLENEESIPNGTLKISGD